MWQLLYKGFTSYEGVYLLYLVPIIYFIIIVVGVFASKRRLHQPIGAKDVIAVLAIGFITLDFINYAYLFFTKTGVLLQPLHLLIKYIAGFFMWLWIFWYSYQHYFARLVAGEEFSKRRTGLILMCAGSLVLAIVGILLS
jgi:hypothetical protein